MTLHREASIYLYSSPLSRFSASHRWIKNATKYGHPSILDAYYTAIKLLPQLAPLSLDLKSRQQMLARKDMASLASASATCAIGLNQSYLAVEFLEASRSIFWPQALQLGTPVDKLENIKPELSAKLRNLFQQLEQASFHDISQNISINNDNHLRSIEAVAAQRHNLRKEWDETVNAVRKVPGFEDFLQPKSFASLCQAAASGPVIILLASGSACSALIVNSSKGVLHVRLPRLDAKTPSTQQSGWDTGLYGGQEGLVNTSTNDVFCRLLAELWEAIVKPVFEVLNLKVSCKIFLLHCCHLSCPLMQKSENPSRLWWCPTGSFSLIPIHAAGIYTEGGTHCVSDYVISSYTPTLTALLDRPAHVTSPFKMTVVIEPHAPGSPALPGTEMELEKIKSRVPSQWLTSLKSTTRDIVIDHLQSSSVVHFACHGTQDLENPLNSGLSLSNGHLNVSHIMHAPLNKDTKNSMRLAFLSAHETAKGDGETPNEAMHLAAALLFAGFGGVVATMW
ncbi:CHAT domain-containing protein [Mycena galericulata]|nr:CHAT domain-containing protein [Mycena galericulata]